MKNVFRYSLKHSIPTLIGFIPVGLAYGVLMQANGLNWLWTGASSILRTITEEDRDFYYRDRRFDVDDYFVT